MDMTLTPRVKESIKTALAMTIAYGIALSMDWDRPYWAGFAVALVSLSTVGRSLNKGVLRMLGTLVALVTSLFFIALFAQDRWYFMMALSSWVGFCAYRMMVSRYSYFWFLAGFASVVISVDGGINPVNAFHTAILRAEETALGLLVYTLVTTLLWPTSNRHGFEVATRALVQVQYRRFSAYRQGGVYHGSEQVSSDQTSEQAMQDLASEHDQRLAEFDDNLQAALTDSVEVGELREPWHRFQQYSVALHEVLDQWYGGRKELGELDMNMLLPALDVAVAEIEQRFVEIDRLLAGEAFQHRPQAIDFSTDQTRVDELSHFHKAVFVSALSSLQRLDRLTHDQLNTLLDIHAPDEVQLPSPQSSVIQPAPADGPWTLDPDAIIAVVRVMLVLWLSYVLWIYYRLPSDTGLLAMAGSMGLIFATTPRISPLILLLPMLSAVTFGGLLLVFVMPKLSDFIDLGAMIFLATFAISYLLSRPQQGMTRANVFVLFLMIIGVANQQQYDFLTVVNTALMFLILVALLLLFSRIPFSLQPDKAFLRMLGRFFRSSEYLMASMRWDPTVTPTRLDNWKRAFHAREVATLPKKLAGWALVVDTRALPGTTTAQVQMLASRLQGLAYRMQELMTARDRPQGDLLIGELLEDVRSWRLKVQAVLQQFSKNPAAIPGAVLRERLMLRMDQLEGRIEETLNKVGGEFDERDNENFYRLIGAYRGFSEALLEYAGTAENVEWQRWRESRF
jgi:uncharacterized membrane protein YccC